MCLSRRHFFIVLVLACAAARSSSAEPAYKGVSYKAFSRNVLRGAGSDESLAHVALLGTNIVALNISWYQETIESSDIAPDIRRTPTLASIEHAFDRIQSLGMKVLLKPNLDLKSNEWRAYIKPRDPDAWFKNYGEFLGTLADVAKRKNVAILSIGTEMNTLEDEAYAKRWRTLIGDIRSRYHGKLTYCANWNSIRGGIGGYQKVPWWDALDYIGIDTYFPLTQKLDPSLTELEAGWSKWADEIEKWHSESGLPQPILFTEVGYPSFDGGNTTPWLTGSEHATQDEEEQSRAYQALLSTVWHRPWCAGIFIWAWEPLPHAGLRYPKGHTPQDKPAETVLARFYGGTVPPRPNTPELEDDQ